MNVKSCPFCGKPFVIEKAITYGVTFWHNSSCLLGQDQRITGPVITWDTEECAIEALNNRPIEDALSTKLAELKAMTCETCLYVCYTPEHPYCREETQEGLRVKLHMTCHLWTHPTSEVKHDAE